MRQPNAVAYTPYKAKMLQRHGTMLQETGTLSNTAAAAFVLVIAWHAIAAYALTLTYIWARNIAK